MNLRKPTGRQIGTGLVALSALALLAFIPTDARDDDAGGAIEVAAGGDGGTTPTTVHDHQKMLRDLAAKHHHHGDATTSDDSGEGHDHSTAAGDHAAHDASAHTATGHTSHDASAHDPATHSGHTATELAAHDHTGATGPASSEHNHMSTPTGNTSPPGHDHHTTTPGSTVPGHQHPTTPTGPITSLSDPRLTAQQKANAQGLIDRTVAGMAPLMTSAAVLAAGYTWINDRAGGFRHYVNFSYLSDGHELDQNHIEAIVMQEQPNGALKVVSALYILELGKTMANVPNIADSLTTWHIHTNLCWRNNAIVGATGPDHCPANSTSIITPPMLHVWLPGAPAQPCGPFAGLGEHGGGDCSHDH